MSGAKRTLPAMPETLIGYARCSTDDQDLTAQRDRPCELGVAEQRIYLDHGLTGTNRARPGLDQALAAVREGDTLVVPKLERHQALPRRAGLRPHRPHGQDVLQHPRHLRRIRSRPAPDAHPRRHGRGQGERANFAASDPSSHPSNSANSSAWPAPASTPSPTSRNCSPCPARRSTGRFNGRTVERAEWPRLTLPARLHLVTRSLPAHPGRADCRLRDRRGQRRRTRACQHRRPATASGQRDRYSPRAISRGASQSRRKAGSHCWHEPERSRRGLEVTSLVATPRVPRHPRRGKTNGPGQSDRGSARYDCGKNS